MSIKDIKGSFRNWKKVNISFFKNQKKNRSTGKKSLNYSPKLLEKVYNESTPVFFLSTGRCGTQYISNILEKSNLLDVYHHAFPELTFHQQFAYENPKSEKTKSIIDASRIELIFESFRRNRIFIETNNRLTFFAYSLAELFPKAKFVHITRHPADFVRSGIRRNWYSGKIIEDIGRLLPTSSTQNWDSMTAVEKNGWLWNETNSFIEKFLKQLSDRKRTLSLTAESLFENNEELEKLISFVGLKNIPANMKSLFKNPVNVQTKGEFQAYDNWDSDQKEQLKKVAKLSLSYNYVL